MVVDLGLFTVVVEFDVVTAPEALAVVVGLTEFVDEFDVAIEDGVELFVVVVVVVL